VKNIIIVCVVALLALACDPAEEESQKLTDFETCVTVFAKAYVLGETCNGYDTPEEALRILAEQDCEDMACDNSEEINAKVDVNACVETMKFGSEGCDDLIIGDICETMPMLTCAF
jgi:hypothetical protein